MRLIHAKDNCQGWQGWQCDNWPYCRVWRGSVLEEAWDNLRGFFALRAAGKTQEANERYAWRFQASRRARLIRKLRARRMARYSDAWAYSWALTERKKFRRA